MWLSSQLTSMAGQCWAKLRKTAEPLELHGSDKVLPCHFMSNSYPDSHTIHSEDSRLTLAVKNKTTRTVNGKQQEGKNKLVQTLAQEDTCYMEVA